MLTGCFLIAQLILLRLYSVVKSKKIKTNLVDPNLQIMILY